VNNSGISPLARPGVSALVLLAIAVYGAMALSAVRTKSATSDEVAHVTAGYAYWALDDYRLQPENGNWPQRWEAMPLAAGGYGMRPDTTTAWKSSDVWTIADRYFHESGHDAAAILSRARFMALLVSCALGLLVFSISSRMFGAGGGWISLAVYVFSPTMLAHGPLATSDVMASLFFTAAVWAMWSVLHDIRPMTLAASVFAVSGLLLSKYSGPMIVPIALVLIGIRLWSNRPVIARWRGRSVEIAGRLRLGSAFAGLIAAHVVVAWLMIWMSYGFRYAAMSPDLPAGAFLAPWPPMITELGRIGDVITWSRAHRVLPEAYLYGFTHTAYYAQHRVAFLNGRTSDVGGFLAFYPYAALVKTTIPALLLIAWASGRFAWRRLTDTQGIRWRRAGTRLYAAAPLLVLIVVYWAFALATNLNLGVRHLMPVIPATFILLGSLGGFVVAPAALRSSWRRAAGAVALAGLLAWHAVESLRIAPDYLAYFNQLDGGPGEAYRHLVDSSLDWGQDLPALKRWLDEQGLQAAGHPPVYLSYFGNARPSYYGIDAIPLPGYPRYAPADVPQPMRAGVYCVSATMYQGIYLETPGAWTDEYQGQFENASFNMKVFDGTAGDAAERERLVRQTGEAFWVNNFAVYQQLRFARLAAYLREREPDASAGYSILIFRLTEADLDQALGPDTRH
jgi:hypothetical protein